MTWMYRVGCGKDLLSALDHGSDLVLDQFHGKLHTAQG
jgi:hypothetical protein